MSSAKLSGLLDIKFKIAIEAPKTYIYPLFRVLSTTTMASRKLIFGLQAKVTYKVRKSVYLFRENLYIYSLYI